MGAKSMTSHRRDLVWRIGAATLVLLIAAALRYFRLGDHPLGIFFDPAINGLDSVRLMQRGGPVIFFPTNGGREAFFMVLLIPFIALFGTTPFAIRFLTTSLSLLTVVVLFISLYDLRGMLFRRGKEPGYNGLYLPFIAGLVLATMYWAVSVSRLGQRPVLVPLLAVLIVWLFLKGWETNRRRWFLLAGLFMGLAGHTYSAARLLPVILVIALLPELFIATTTRLKRRVSVGNHFIFLPDQAQLMNLIVFLLAALTIYAPLAWYLVNHPAQFTARAGSVMIWNFLPTPAAIVTELGLNAGRIAAFFCCRGSPNPIFGPPGYPGLPLLLAPFLLLGLAVTVRRWRHLFYRLVFVWWLAGISPSLIAIEAPHPLRMIVALPATAILVGLGFTVITNQPARNLKPEGQSPNRRAIIYILPVIFILLPLPAMMQAYFTDWTARQDTRGVYDYGAVAIRDAVLAHSSAGLPIYMPMERFNDSTLLYYLSGSFDREAVLEPTPAESALVIAPEGNITDTVWVRLVNERAQILPPLDTSGQQIIQAGLTAESAQVVTDRWR
jgi:hypothetical protein